MTTKATQRVYVFTELNKLPKEKWFSFGDLCQLTHMNPKTLRSFLTEAKRLKAIQSQSYTVANGFGSSNWNQMYKRVADLEIPT